MEGSIFKILIIFIIPLCWDTSVAMDIQAISSGKRKSHGERCGVTLDCDVDSMLDCIGGRCTCMIWAEYSISIAGLNTNTFTFEQSTGKCVSRLGEMCKFSVKDRNGTDFLYEETSCIDNANCEKDGICRCHGRYQEQPNGTCQLPE